MTATAPPTGFTADHAPGRLRITYRMRSLQHVAFAVGGVIALSVYLANPTAGGREPYQWLLAGLAFAALGFPPCLNRTAITLDRESIAVATGPLPSLRLNVRRPSPVRHVKHCEYSVRALFSRQYYNAVVATLDDGEEIELYRVEQDEQRAIWVRDQIADFIERTD